MAWLYLLRVHQFVKNVLVFVPLVTAHKFELPAIVTATIAAAAPRRNYNLRENPAADLL